MKYLLSKFLEYSYENKTGKDHLKCKTEYDECKSKVTVHSRELTLGGLLDLPLFLTLFVCDS